MAKSVVSGGARYFSAMVFASPRTARSSSRPATATPSASARSAASTRRSYCSLGNFASMGIHTGGPPSTMPGNFRANSTRAPLPGSVSTFFAYWSTVSTCSSSISSCTSPQVPRVFTLVSTRFRSPTPSASCCISPRPWWTFSSRSDTCWNEALKRVSSVACSFSSTVLRISSRRAPLSACKSRILFSKVARTSSMRCAFDSVSWANV